MGSMERFIRNSSNQIPSAFYVDSLSSSLGKGIDRTGDHTSQAKRDERIVQSRGLWKCTGDEDTRLAHQAEGICGPRVS